MITGAARGIGASMARQLHQRGARLVLIDVDESGLRVLSEELGEQGVACFGCDVNDFDAMHAAARAAVARFGAIDVVVANAGTEHWAPVRTVEPDAFRRVIETNVIGVFNTVRVALPSIIDQRGYILVVASVSSYTAVPGMASYGASKAGAEQFANVLRIELADCGVAVGSAYMSLVDTPMLRETQSNSPEFTSLVASQPALVRRPLTAHDCAARLIEAIERRRRHVDAPKWVVAARWFKPMLSMPITQRQLRRQMRRIEAGDGREGPTEPRSGS
jgi:NAD(P)-dependent dehydrogenase (short-subunit alcohol dehydrogenase family)